MSTKEVNASVAGKALILHGIRCLFGIGFITIWSPLFAKLSCKLSHDDKRVRGEIGILKKSRMDSPISKVNSVRVDQGILGRILNYGTVRINLSGDRDDYSFTYIDNPNEFKDSLLSLVEKLLSRKI